MTALKTKFLKYIDSVTNEEHLYEVIPPAPTETDRGGIIASPKTDDYTVEAKLGEDGKLYVPTISGVASWNDLEDKPFYISKEEETITEDFDIIPEDTYEFELYNIYGCNPRIQYKIEIGQTYFVIWDGIEYEFVAYDDNGYPTIGATWSDLENGTATIPFQICSYEDNGLYYISMATPDTSLSHTIRMYNSATIVTPSEMYMEPKYLPHFQSDWNLNDETKVGYIKNRPFYLIEAKTETEIVEIMPETTFEFQDTGYGYLGVTIPEILPLVSGKFYTVLFNGEIYENVICYSGDGYFALGASDPSFTDYPFSIGAIIGYGSQIMVTTNYSTSNTFSIIGEVEKHIPEKVCIDPKYVSHLQSNWNEIDETTISYINNKPFYHKKGFETLIPETTVETDEYEEISSSTTFKVGTTYIVTFNGEEYECVCWYSDDKEAYMLGNGDIYGGTNVETGEIGGNGEPFVIDSYDDGECYLNVSEYGTYTIKVEGNVDELKKIEDKYQHQADWNEIDDSKASYVLNKPFGEYISSEDGEIIFDSTVSLSYDSDGYYDSSWLDDIFELSLDDYYEVTFDGNVYSNLICYMGDYSYLTIGSLEQYGLEIVYDEEDNEVKFYISEDKASDGEFSFKIVKCEIGVNKIDPKYLPEDNVTNTSIVLTDIINGYDYIIQMQNGQLVSYCKASSIEIIQMPNKTEYYEGDEFDPTGMIVVAKAQDGTTREISNYSFPVSILNQPFIITYTEGSTTLSIEVPITIISIEPFLIDFTYTKETDNTYTLTDWKGTLNGEPSTEILIPNYSIINV